MLVFWTLPETLYAGVTISKLDIQIQIQSVCSGCVSSFDSLSEWTLCVGQGYWERCALRGPSVCLTASSHSSLTAVSFFIPFSFRLHSESGSAHSAPTAPGAALPVCAHCSAAVRRSPDLKVRAIDRKAAFYHNNHTFHFSILFWIVNNGYSVKIQFNSFNQGKSQTLCSFIQSILYYIKML